MSNPQPCLRRTEPSAALIPRPGQRALAYVPAERSDIRQRIHEFNRFIVHPAMPSQPRLNAGTAAEREDPAELLASDESTAAEFVASQ